MKSYFKKYWIEVSVVTVITTVLLISFVHFYVLNTFVSYDFVPCDPAFYACFVQECSENDSRCTPYVNEEGVYNFAVEEHKGSTITNYYCADDTKALFSTIVLDPMCSQ